MPIYLKDHYQKKKNIKESKEVNAAGTKYLKTSLLRLLIFSSAAFIKTEKTGFRWDKYRLRRIKTEVTSFQNTLHTFLVATHVRGDQFGLEFFRIKMTKIYKEYKLEGPG